MWERRRGWGRSGCWVGSEAARNSEAKADHGSMIGLSLLVWSAMLMVEAKMASLDWFQCPAVESVPGKVSGAWVLKGTRMPVSVIFENLGAGANIDEIMQWYDGLNREQVKAVIEFAARSLDKAPACAS